MRPWLKLRTSEWVLIGFFAYVAGLSVFFPERPGLSFQPALLLVGVSALLWLLAQFERIGGRSRQVSIVRDWLPLGLTLIAFREMELFLPMRFGHRLESEWIAWDLRILSEWHLRNVIESLGGLIPFILELSYLLVYGAGFFCIALLYAQGRRDRVDRFMTVYLTGTLLAYALFPYFPSEPPRILFPQLDAPQITSWVRRVNLWILNVGTIHLGVFPSAHVSSAFSAAWGLFQVLEGRKTLGWILLVYAATLSVATVYGRYHYAIDVLAGIGVSLIAGLLCLLGSTQQLYPAKNASV
ncbi:MAG: phosphatase PAP2 family protein [Acidobacteriaceae bacterium]|nr:phosphatase PAP2 family protein [Acidobacteriaceae bacterium]MBV9780233.1 phosphatase PAP2 family protein [Acidobacteriaceae bacterium]